MIVCWQDFLDQAIRDQKSSKILFEEGDFGNSAYLLQQCMEKYVKAVVFKHKLYNGEPKHLRHIQLPVLWRELSEKYDAMLKRSRNPHVAQWRRGFAEIMEAIQLFFDSIEKDLMIVMWKESLEIPLTTEEKDKITSVKKRLEEIRPACKKIGRDYDDQFCKMKQFVKLSQTKRGKQLEDFINFIRQYFKFEKIEDGRLSPQEMFTIQTPTDIVTTLDDILKKIGPGGHSGISRKGMVLVILLSWIFTFQGVILKTFPHESIGRYPRPINGEDSDKLYVQHKKALMKLSNEVDTACKRLSFML